MYIIIKIWDIFIHKIYTPPRDFKWLSHSSLRIVNIIENLNTADDHEKD